jgi:hypothetical protein
MLPEGDFQILHKKKPGNDVISLKEMSHTAVKSDG